MKVLVFLQITMACIPLGTMTADAPIPFFYRTSFNFFLSVFFLCFTEIPYFTPLCISSTTMLWLCCVLIAYGHKMTSAILIWHAASCISLVVVIALSGGVTSEYIPVVSLVLVSGFAVESPQVGIITAYFLVFLYGGVLLLPKDWDMMRNFPYRDALRVIIFVFSMFCHSSLHKTISCRVKSSTAHELKKAARQTTALIDTVMTLGVPMIAMTATDLMNKEKTVSCLLYCCCCFFFVSVVCLGFCLRTAKTHSRFFHIRR